MYPGKHRRILGNLSLLEMCVVSKDMFDFVVAVAHMKTTSTEPH